MAKSTKGAITAPQPPPVQNVRPLCAMDLGNYQSTTMAQSGHRTVRSIFARLPQGRSSFPSTPNSPAIVVDGERYHVGHRAEDYRGCRAAVIGNKADHARLLFLATVPDAVLEAGSLDLVVTHHDYDDSDVEAALRMELRGCHRFTRAGQEHVLSVESVTVAPESYGVWHLAYPSGSHDAMTVVIDLGGGSWNAAVLDHKGNPVAQAGEDKGGVVWLAKQIALDDRLLKVIRSRGVKNPKIPAIMNGLATDNRYFGDPNIDWSPWYGHYVNEWWDNIRGTVLIEFEDWKDRCDRIIVTGGGAHLLRNRYRNSQTIIIPKEPHLANITGTLQRYQGGDA